MSQHPAFPVSAFGDEAGPSVDEQVEALVKTQIGGLDVRSVNGVNVLDLSESALEAVRTKCDSRGRRVQAVGSPVNKVPLGGDTHAAEVKKLRTAVEAATRLQTSRIRIFTPEVARGHEDEAWPAVRDLVAEMIDIAKGSGIVLIHENDGSYFGAYPENAKRLFGELGGPNFKAAFDFANTVLIGYRPMSDWFPWLLPHLDTLHIKDAIETTGEIVPAGKGDGQVVETLRWLILERWHGPLTSEPHLKAAGPRGGFSGPELFEVAAGALRDSVIVAGGTTEAY